MINRNHIAKAHVALFFLQIVMILLNASHVTAQSTTRKARAAQSKPVEITPLKCKQRVVPDFLWGVTVTTVEKIPEITSALADFKSAFPDLKPNELPPIMVRIVFDPSSRGDFEESLRQYQVAVANISEHSYVLGMIADSYDWHPYTTPESESSTSGHNNYPSRMKRFVEAMGDCVQVWEIGNEVNGEWTGWEGEPDKRDPRLPDMREKIGKQITQAFNVVRDFNQGVPEASRKQTAITILYNNDGSEHCYTLPQYEMYDWARKYIDPVVRENIDYVLLSYYENKMDCPGLKQDALTFVNVFKNLAARTMFPNAKMGFGEVGYKATCPENVKKRPNDNKCIVGDSRCRPNKMCIGQAAYIRKYYQTLTTEIRTLLACERLNKRNEKLPNFIGGYFYWFFNQDMTGRTEKGDSSNQQRNRGILKEAMPNQAKEQPPRCLVNPP